jgi:hypothetical protein
LATPAPINPRQEATPAPAAISFEAKVFGSDGGVLYAARATDLSRAGAFICSPEPHPAPFTRLRIAIGADAGSVVVDAEVVRHVTAAQAKAWNMSPGFGVQFAQAATQVKQRVERMIKGLPPEGSEPVPNVEPPPDAVAERIIEIYKKRLAGDHYVVLALHTDCEMAEVKQQGRDLVRELTSLSERQLPLSQRTQVQAAMDRVNFAVETLSNPKKRAEHDARFGNFRGVARCLSAGLTVTELEQVRARFLANHPTANSTGQVQFATGNAWEQQGNLRAAVTAYESALGIDPLNLAFQQRFWMLKRKLK